MDPRGMHFFSPVRKLEGDPREMSEDQQYARMPHRLQMEAVMKGLMNTPGY